MYLGPERMKFLKKCRQFLLANKEIKCEHYHIYELYKYIYILWGQFSIFIPLFLGSTSSYSLYPHLHIYLAIYLFLVQPIDLCRVMMHHPTCTNHTTGTSTRTIHQKGHIMKREGQTSHFLSASFCSIPHLLFLASLSPSLSLSSLLHKSQQQPKKIRQILIYEVVSSFHHHHQTNTKIISQSPSINQIKNHRSLYHHHQREKVVSNQLILTSKQKGKETSYIMSASSSSTCSFSPDHHLSPSDQLCYVHCRFCDTFLAVCIFSSLFLRIHFFFLDSLILYMP